MKKLLFGFVFLLFASVASGSNVESLPSTNTALLDLLDKELAKREYYINLRSAGADSLKRLVEAKPDRKIELYMQLGIQMAPLNCDSAIAVFDRGYDAAVKAGDSVNAQRFQILKASELRKFGATPDAIAALSEIRNKGIFKENRMIYAETARDLNLYIAEILENSRIAKSYLNDGMLFAKDQLEYLHPDSSEAQVVQSIIYYAQGKRPLAAASLHSLSSELEMDDPIFSLSMTMLGGQYYYLNSYDDAVRYLALAAISDVRHGDRKGSALIRLGKVLYDRDELLRAYKYLSVSLENAIKANDMTNMVLVSDALMPVTKDLGSHAKRRMLMLVGLVVALSVVILLLCCLYGAKKRRIREVEQVKRQLANANKAKEVYISEFINLCSGYMGRLEDFNRMCSRKIKAGQVDDLMAYIKDGKILDEQRQKLDDIFDETFLAIYPDFIKELNRLLLPDKQIVVSQPNVLTTELRVLAFARLGLDDTAQVARFLGVSTNTIYTYRNKFRNMAVNRETFDADILRIGVIE